MPTNVKNAIDDNGVLYLYQKIKGEMPSKTSDLLNDSTFQTAQNVADSIAAALATLTIPTKVSDLQNDAGYQNATQVQTAIDDAISQIGGLSIDWSHQTLPASGDSNTIYAIPTGGADDPYDFYIWNSTDNKWIRLDFNIDMSGYMKTSDIHWMTNAEIDALLAE